MRKIILSIVGAGLLLGTTVCSAGTTTTTEANAFDTKMIEVQKKMISSNPNFSVDDVRIIKKKKIDEKWQMYSFDISLTERQNNKKFSTPMVIFTDGKYETNSLVNIDTGVRYETAEIKRLKELGQSESAKKQNVFEKSFVLDNKYYNEEHLISGALDAKNKVVIISDPLCIACIGTFPPIYKQLKERKDYAFFYYHFPLKRLHPTSETIAKAMVLAKKSGVNEIELKVYEANFDKLYDVYKNKDNKFALSVFNKNFGTNFTMNDINKVSISEDAKIADDVHLKGTPTVIFNGSLLNSRSRLIKSLEQK